MCLVNKAAHIVIYLYDDGSRGREVLRDILKDTQIAALQSDGYNVYMYIDNELDDVDHLCCMAHARAKFKYAYEQGGTNELSVSWNGSVSYTDLKMSISYRIFHRMR